MLDASDTVSLDSGVELVGLPILLPRVCLSLGPASLLTLSDALEGSALAYLSLIPYEREGSKSSFWNRLQAPEMSTLGLAVPETWSDSRESPDLLTDWLLLHTGPWPFFCCPP